MIASVVSKGFKLRQSPQLRASAPGRSLLLLLSQTQSQPQSQCRHYHSYPDPEEKPRISTFVASSAPASASTASASSSASPNAVIDKSGGVFDLHPKFRLDTVFPGYDAPRKPITDSTTPRTVATTLANGLTVATQESHGLMTSLAFVVRTGSSYEDATECGSTHFLELNAFRSTKFRDHQKLITDVEELGGMVQCIATRENILYCIDVLKENSEAGLDILAETINHPTFPDEELEDSRAIAGFQHTDLPSAVFSRDLVQKAAYGGSPLGKHHFCPLDRVGNITSTMLQDFRKKHYFGANSVLSGVGVDHNQLVEWASKKFATFPSGSRVSRSESIYTGGMLSEERELKEPFVRLAMGFEVGGWKSSDLVAVCVVQQLLGGGSSFSAGGPGKGMYTRLYTQVLNQFQWAESVEAFVSIHEESGLLGIDGQCPPEHLSSLLRVIVDQFSRLAHIPVTKEELSRAKNMLKSMMMMQLESRLVVCEDIARQYTTYGFRESPTVICEKIDAITERDLMRVASLMLEKPPSIGVVGSNLSMLPAFEDIKVFTQQFSHHVWLQAGQKQ